MKGGEDERQSGLGNAGPWPPAVGGFHGQSPMGRLDLVDVQAKALTVGELLSEDV